MACSSCGRAAASRAGNSPSNSIVFGEPTNEAVRVRVLDGVAGAAHATARERTHPGFQLLQRKRFGHVVIGPRIEPRDPVLDRIPCRQDEHGQARFSGADFAQHLVARSLRQHEVEDHRVETLALQQRFAFACRAGDGQAEARPAEIVTDHPGETGVVVDHQDPLGHLPRVSGRIDPDVTVPFSQAACRGPGSGARPTS